MIAAVYRVPREYRDWKGSITEGDLPDYYLGEVDGVVMGGPAPQPIPRFPGMVSTEGLIGIPRIQSSNIVVQQNDRLIIEDVLYVVRGPRQWDFDNALTSWPNSHYWVLVEASH